MTYRFDAALLIRNRAPLRSLFLSWRENCPLFFNFYCFEVNALGFILIEDNWTVLYDGQPRRVVKQGPQVTLYLCSLAAVGDNCCTRIVIPSGFALFTVHTQFGRGRASFTNWVGKLKKKPGWQGLTRLKTPLHLAMSFWWDFFVGMGRSVLF